MGFLQALGLERFRVSKLKPNLKMAEQRLGILTSKKTNLIKTQKRDIASLLREGKEEKARIRVEHLIRMDFTIEAYELIGLLCELLHERAALVASEKECPPDLREAMCTLIWASARCEVPEMKEIAHQLELKYGKEFAAEARANDKGCVNGRVLHKLGVAPPSAYLVVKYLGAIAEEHNVAWTEPELGLDPESLASSAMPGPSGFSVPVAPGSGLEEAYAADGSPVARPPPMQVTVPPPVATVNPNVGPIAPVVAIVQPDAPLAAPAPPPPAKPEPPSYASAPPAPAPAPPPPAYDIPAAPGFGDAPPAAPAPPGASSSSSSAPAPPPPEDARHHEQMPHISSGGDDDERPSDYSELQKRFENLRR